MKKNFLALFLLGLSSYPLNAQTNTFPTTGNVGIGTTNPQGLLHVGDNTNAGIVLGNRLSTVSSSIPVKIFWAESTMPKRLSGDLVIAPRTDISASISFYTFDGNNIDERFKIAGDGNASLQGKLEAKEIKVTTTPTADFVFAEKYELPTLEDVEKHIKEKKHLPEIASAEEMEKDGVNVGEFQIKLLQKIEELTLYQIELNKKILNLEKEIKSLKK